MSQKYEKPLPQPNEITGPFWEASKNHELKLQRCGSCGGYRYPPGEICPHCRSNNLEWVKVSGRGKVYTWSVIHQVYHPAFAEEVPYALVAVELEEGPRMVTNLVGCPPEEISVDMPVAVTFEDVTDEISLPKFRPERGK